MVSFAVGEASKTITVTIAGDQAVELDETFSVTLSGASTGATIGSATAIGTIANDDAQLSIATLAASKAEGQAGTTALTFAVSRTGNISTTHTASFTVAGSGVNPANGSDFAGASLPSGIVSFAVGEASKIITANVAADTTVEATEDFTVTLSAPSTGATIGTATATGTIINDDAQLSIAALAVSKVEGNSGTVSLTFSVTRTGDTSTSHTASFTVAGSGANPASAADFAGGALPAGTVSFAAGETSRTITVNALADATIEADETFTVTLLNPSTGATIGTATATGTILSDDAQLSIAAASASRAEGQSGSTALTFTVTRTGDASSSHSATFTVVGSGANSASPADFADGALPTGTVSFAPGETTRTISIPVAGDALVELDETVIISLGSPSAGAIIGTATATGTILNDDAQLSIAAASATRAEGQSGSAALTFTVTRTGDTSTSHSASFTVAGSGANPASAADFAGGTLPTGTVSFAPGETTKTIAIPMAGDALIELDETFIVALASPSAGAIIGTAAATGTILNDDAQLSIAAASATRAEGQSGSAALTFTVTRAGDTSTSHTASFTVAGSGANPASLADFAGGAFPAGTVSFAPGETTKTIAIPVAGDALVELDETFIVSLASPSAGATIGTATATGRIVNDDAQLSIAALAASKPEGQSGSTALTFTVTRTGDTTTSHTANFAIAGSGATPANGSDFVGGIFPAGVVSFAPGATSRTITVNVAADAAVEPNEGFSVSLSTPSAGATIGTATAIGTIVNDDTQLSIAALAASKVEGNSGTTTLTFTVTRSGNTTASHTVPFTVAGSGANPASAADFAGGVLPSGLVSFAPGQTSRTISINVATELALEADETFLVSLGSPSSGATLGTASATGTIVNDDVPPTGTLSIARLMASRAEGQSGTTPFTFQVSRTGNTSGPAWANWVVTGGGIPGTVGASASDFGGTLPSGAVTFAVGETTKLVTVNVSGDTAAELNESFSVTLSGTPTGVTVATSTATATIWNDDTPGTGTLAIARSSAQKAEGQSGTTAFTFTVTRGGDLTGTASADWAVTGGGAPSTVSANAADFAGGILPSGRVGFAAGQGLTTITVNVAADSTIELNDSFTVTLAAPQLGVAIGTPTATGVILNDDFPPSGVLSIAGLQADRGEGASGSTAFTFVVTRAGSIAGPASANWAATAGTATAADFTGAVLPSGSVTFAPGQASQVVTLTVAGDTAVEADETFTVSLSGVPTGVSIGTASATGTIRNDDPAGTGTLAIARASAQKAEGASGTTPFTFTVTRSGDLSGVAAADWAVSGGGATGTTPATGADFATGQFPSGRVTFAAGQAVQTVEVNVAAETVAEKNESFTVALSNAQAGVAVTRALATGVIANDDFASTAANQTLTGTDAADVFLLGGGLDSVVAKAGLDQFRFLPTAIGPAASNATTLQDFSRVAGEVLDLSAIDAIAGTLADNAFSFIGTAAFTAAGQLRWQDQGTVRLIQGEVTGDGIADLTIMVKAPGPIDSTWFAL